MLHQFPASCIIEPHAIFRSVRAISGPGPHVICAPASESGDAAISVLVDKLKAQGQAGTYGIREQHHVRIPPSAKRFSSRVRDFTSPSPKMDGGHTQSSCIEEKS